SRLVVTRHGTYLLQEAVNVSAQGAGRHPQPLVRAREPFQELKDLYLGEIRLAIRRERQVPGRCSLPVRHQQPVEQPERGRVLQVGIPAPIREQRAPERRRLELPPTVPGYIAVLLRYLRREAPVPDGPD